MGQYLGISQWQFPDLGGFASSRTGQILLGGAAGAILGAAISSNLKLVVLLIGAVLAGIAVAAAFNHPERAFIGLVLVMALIPTYAAPKMSSLLFIPAAGLAWLLAAALAWRNAMQRGRPFSLTAIDLLVVLFFILLYVSLQFSPQVDFKSDFLNNIFAWLGPFLAARLLLQDCKDPVRVIAAAFAAALVVIAPVAVLETLGVKNPFFNLQFNASEAAAFGNAVNRLGQVRAQASFGHPIALSMFASASALLSLGMAIYSSASKERLFWLGLAALGVGVQALTVSRTGWLMLVFGVVLLGLTTALRAARKRLTTVFAVVGVALVVLSISGAAPKELQLVPGTGAGEEARQFQDSSAYRERLINRAFEDGVLGLWGNPYNKVSLAVSTTNQATDNAYIILADHWGLIPTFSLVAIAAALLMAIALARKREANELVILPITALVSLCALFFVAFITQQQCFVWLLIGAASAGSERVLRRRRENRNRTRRNDAPLAPPQRLEVIPERW